MILSKRKYNKVNKKTSLSNPETPKHSPVDRHAASRSNNKELNTFLNIETTENRIEAEETLVKPESPVKSKENIAGMEPNLVSHLDEGAWIEVKPRRNKIHMHNVDANRQCQRLNTKVQEANHLSVNLEQKRLESRERKISFVKDNFQQKAFNTSICMKGETFSYSSNSSDIKTIDVAYEDSREILSSENPIMVHHNLNQEYDNPSEQTPKFSGQYINEHNSTFVKETKSAKQSEAAQLNMVKHFHIEKSSISNESSQEHKFKDGGQFSSNSEQRRACRKIENRAHKTESNQIRFADIEQEKSKESKISKSQSRVMDKKTVNKSSGRVDTINGKQVNDYTKVKDRKDAGYCNIITDINLNEKSNQNEIDILINAKESTSLKTNAQDECKHYEQSPFEAIGLKMTQSHENVNLNNSANNTDVYNAQSQRNKIPSENVYFLPNDPVSILPLHPEATKSIFRPQFNGPSIPETPNQCFDNGKQCNYVHQNPFQSYMNYDQRYYQKHVTNEKGSENATASQNSNVAVYNPVINMASRPFVLSWIDRGMVYFQYYPDFAPVSYPCFVSAAGQNSAAYHTSHHPLP